MEDNGKDMSLLRKIAYLFGVVLLLSGIMGFIPFLTTGDDDGVRRLLGIFEVDTVHNLVHIATGIVAMLSAKSDRLARIFFITFGLVYTLITLIGFAGDPDAKVLGFLHVNQADNFLHLGIAAVSLAAGLLLPDRKGKKLADPSD